MRTNSRPLVRGAWYYDVGDLVHYRGSWAWDFDQDNLAWRVTYVSPVRQDGERQSVTIEADTRKYGLYRLSTSNTDLIPVGAQ